MKPLVISAIALCVASLPAQESAPASRRAAAVSGVVRDPEKRPIADATVVLETPPKPNIRDCLPTIPRFPETRTDAAGSYSFPHVLAGSYVLFVRHPGRAPRISETFVVPQTGVAAQPDIVLVPGAKIQGRVKLANGSPDPKAMVQISPVDDRPRRDFRSVYTDSNGRFEAADLAAGEYRVLVAQRNGQPDLAVLFTTLKNPNVFKLAEGEVKDLDL